jgi:hypothetical protein
MQAFMGLAESVVTTLAKRLEELPAVEEPAGPEGIVLSVPPVLPDPFEDD